MRFTWNYSQIGSLTIKMATTLAVALAPMASFTAARAHADTTTPIKHVVVLYPENISFDHYFGTYPFAANNAGETLQGSPTPAAQFTALPGTAIPNNYIQRVPNPSLTTLKPELFTPDPDRNSGYVPFRLNPSQALTCDQNHGYSAEQKAFDNGKMDKFYEVNVKLQEKCNPPATMYGRNDLVMGYYDGNTVTAYWNLAQHFLLNDNHYGSIFGPSTPGHINLIAGQTHPTVLINPTNNQPTTSGAVIATDKNSQGSLINDPDPYWDDCSNLNGKSSDALAQVKTRNIGDLLTEHNVTWGWFQGGFRANGTQNGKAVCTTAHKNVGGLTIRDFSPHHEPFQYFQSTANPHHLPPENSANIGHSDQANHQYDVQDFYTALKENNLPAVSFIKPPEYQDGHASYSDPIDENHFAEKLVNQLQQSPDWDSTALIIAYDDSDGWYDHMHTTILSGSHTSKDHDICQGTPAYQGIEGRCGPGTRHPFLLISPYVHANQLDSTPTEQTSVIRFIEDNWNTGRLGGGSFDERAGAINSLFDFTHPPRQDKLWLDEVTGQVTTKDKVSVLNITPHPYLSAATAVSHVNLFETWGKPIICILALLSFAAGTVYLLSRKARQK